MSDHISGPRALADPIADITDVYAFPSPEHPGRLVLVENTLPFAQPSALFSDGLVYRFRLRPLTVGADNGSAPFSVGEDELVFDCVFSDPDVSDDMAGQEGVCTTPAGDTVGFRVGDEQGGSGHGVRVFAGPRWDPFIMDAPAALKTIATGTLAFTDPGSIYMDGKNVLSLVVEIDCARFLEDGGLVGLGDADARQADGADRAGRSAGGEELDAGAEAVRSGEPRPRDPRSLQHGRRIPSRRGLPGRISRAAQRQPRLLGRPRRQDRLAFGR